MHGDVQSHGKRNPREDWEEETYQVFLGLGNRSNKKLRNHEEGLFMVLLQEATWRRIRLTVEKVVKQSLVCWDLKTVRNF